MSQSEVSGNKIVIQNKALRIFTLLAGVILPAVALITELSTRMCAEVFFDPLPTVWHAALIGFVPAANLAAWLTSEKTAKKMITYISFSNGMALGITFFYTIIFLPLLPLSVMAVLIYGLGLLSLSPLFSFVSAILLRRRLKKIAVAEQYSLPELWRGTALALGLLLLFELPQALTRFGMQMAAGDSIENQNMGVALLRSCGDEDLMLRMCYERSRLTTGMVGFLFALGQKHVQPSAARKIFYRVTGEAFNSRPRPQLGWGGNGDAFVFDDGQGGDNVAGRINGLSLSSSRMDGSLDPDAALGYLEWTLVFQNNSRLQREARAQVKLPPGGVVSRLTLWVDGEEREAAFAGRGQVRKAYGNVVRQRRDPVLVTTSGTDQVLIQCFPVEPDKEMKIRFGITFPLLVESRDEGILLLPCFTERNFAVPEQVGHFIWIESNKNLRAAQQNFAQENPKDGLYVLRGKIADQNLSGSAGKIRAQRASQITSVWCPAAREDKKSAVQQVIEQRKRISPQQIILVIDGSRAMAPYIPAIAGSLKNLPENMDFGVVLAGDKVVELTKRVEAGNNETLQHAAHKLLDQEYRGGRDNIPALQQGVELAGVKENSVMVWLHGPQPVLLQNTETLRQLLERRPGLNRILDINVAPGPNRIIEKMSGPIYFRSMPRLNTIDKDLEKLFAELAGGKAPITLKRSRISYPKLATQDDLRKTSFHLARLWAYDEIMKLYAASKEGREQAVRMAVDYQLVTPVSGAVVLENARQYKDAGLEPVDAVTVPTIPEPEVVFLMIIVGLLLFWTILNKKLPCCPIPKR